MSAAVGSAAISDPLLMLRGVKTYYGNVIALKGVDVDVHEGEIVALIGANGAGKSTLMMTVFGNPRAQRGRDPLRRPRHHRNGDARDRQAAHRAVAGGPAHLPAHDGAGKSADRRHGERRRRTSRATSSGCSRCSRGCATACSQRGGTLSGGEQQMLAIGRALMGRPRLMLLDEPSLGLAPLLVQQIFAAIRALNERDRLTVFLVEQNAYHALKLAHRGYVMVNGEITLHRRTGATCCSGRKSAPPISKAERAEEADMDELYAGESICRIVLVTGVTRRRRRGFPAAPSRAPGGRRGRWSSPHSCSAPRRASSTFALFQGELLSLPSYACDTLIFVHRRACSPGGRLAPARWCGNIPGSMPVPARSAGAKVGREDQTAAVIIVRRIRSASSGRPCIKRTSI